MNEPGVKPSVPRKPVERLFPFVLRSRNLIVGRDTLARSKSRLHFVLITHDISDRSRAEILADFTHYPVVQHFTTEDLEKFFNLQGAKVIGFEKSGLAKSIYAELKEHRLNQPMHPSKPEPAAGAKPADQPPPSQTPPPPTAPSGKPGQET